YGAAPGRCRGFDMGQRGFATAAIVFDHGENRTPAESTAGGAATTLCGILANKRQARRALVSSFCWHSRAAGPSIATEQSVLRPAGQHRTRQEENASGGPEGKKRPLSQARDEPTLIS